MLAVQADGARIDTIEGVSPVDQTLSVVQAALAESQALQCGFCTPGIVMSLTSAIAKDADENALLEILSGHLCRCTGYQGLRRAAQVLASNHRKVAA
jgi:carbon-monoxide dehydrogenase small subunit